jgi:hypothetical protein
MKQIISSAVLILLFTCFPYARTADEKCPQIILTLPETLLVPERPATFSVKLEWDEDASKLEYVWIISGGDIIKEHGTRTIEFAAKEEDQGRNIGVAVKVVGLPSLCADTVSDIIAVAALPIGEPSIRSEKNLPSPPGPDSTLFWPFLMTTVTAARILEA